MAPERASGAAAKSLSAFSEERRTVRGEAPRIETLGGFRYPETTTHGTGRSEGRRGLRSGLLRRGLREVIPQPPETFPVIAEPRIEFGIAGHKAAREHPLVPCGAQRGATGILQDVVRHRLEGAVRSVPLRGARGHALGVAGGGAARAGDSTRCEDRGARGAGRWPRWCRRGAGARGRASGNRSRRRRTVGRAHGRAVHESRRGGAV